MALQYKKSEAERVLREAGAKDAPVPAVWAKSEKAPKMAEQTKEQLHAENYKKNKRELDRIKVQMDRLAPQIRAIENEMSALGAQVNEFGKNRKSTAFCHSILTCAIRIGGRVTERRG